MLTIRLSRTGKRNKPMYRMIISEKARTPQGRALEIFGFYNPHDKILEVKEDRIKYWISKGAQMSPTVNNLLIDKKIIEGEKVKASKVGKKKKEEKGETGNKDSIKEEVKEEKKGEVSSKDSAKAEVKEEIKEEEKKGNK
ncbi:30S ribosomal protein S16 [bacterium]|nr:30S ribosomal protein S16 [bacterium]